ncbi:MAG: hypothetical protein JO202_07085 [Ktedonobacteraceae bacterium]|nr:hypothetical protein [Ktedonobacteraceae bacterium]
MAHHENSDQVQQIGDYTVTATKHSLEIRRDTTTFTFTPTEVWDLFDLIHDQIYAYYLQMRELGLGPYPATDMSIHLPCCTYLLEGFLRRGEVIPSPPTENGVTVPFIVDFVEQMHLKEERERDRLAGWPSSPQEPITAHWTRMNDTLMLCAGTIAARYGTQRAQSSSPWRVVVNYTILAEQEVAIQLGFWRMSHPGADRERLTHARQDIIAQLGLREGMAVYTPEEFLKRASEWSQPSAPMILEYDATGKHAEHREERLVVAKLYPGGHLEPCAFVYQSLQ